MNKNEEERKKKEERLREIKMKRLMMSFYKIYDIELKDGQNNVKKIDSQQITRCSFDILAFLLRNFENRSSTKNRSKKKNDANDDRKNCFSIIIEYISNITDETLIDKLKHIYTRKTEGIDKKWNEKAPVFEFISCETVRKQEEKHHTVWKFRWYISEKNTTFIWIKNSVLSGSMIEDQKSDIDISRKRKRIEDRAKFKDDDMSDDITDFDPEKATGVCDFFYLLSGIIENTYKDFSSGVETIKKDVGINEVISSFFESEDINMAIEESTKCALTKNEKTKKEIKQQLEKTMFCLPIKMALANEDNFLKKKKQFFYPLFNQNVVKKLVIEVHKASNVVKRIDNIKTISNEEKNRTINNELSRKSKDLFFFDFVREIKKEKTTTTSSSSSMMNNNDTIKSSKNAGRARNIRKKTTKSDNVVSLREIMNIIKTSFVRDKKVKKLDIKSLKGKVEKTYGSYEIGRIISSCFSEKNKKMRIIGMHDVYCLDLILFLSVLLIEEDKIIKKRIENIFKKNRYMDFFFEEYIEQVPSIFGMCSMKNFYSACLASCNLDRIVISKMYNEDTNAKREPINKNKPKEKILLESVKMIEVNKEIESNGKITFDARRICLPGGPPTWTNVGPISCTDFLLDEREKQVPLDRQANKDDESNPSKKRQKRHQDPHNDNENNTLLSLCDNGNFSTSCLPKIVDKVKLLNDAMHIMNEMGKVINILTKEISKDNEKKTK